MDTAWSLLGNVGEASSDSRTEGSLDNMEGKAYGFLT